VSWVAAVDYRRGSLRQKRGLPCQDYGKLRKIGDDIVLGVLSDGSAEAPLAQLGTKAVVRSAMSFLTRRVEADPGTARRLSDSLELFDGMLEQVRAALMTTAREVEARPEGLACTLLAFIAGPSGIAAQQIGDSFLACRTQADGYDYLFQPAVRSDRTRTFITSPEAVRIDAIKAMSCPVEFICAGTDGMGAASNQRGPVRPENPFLRKLDDYMATTRSDTEAHEGIRRILRSDRLTDQAQDDMALMICAWRAGDGIHSATRPAA